MLRKLGEELWVVDHDLKLLGIAIGTRTSIIRLAGGGLLLHSPGPLCPELIESIDSLGPVRCIVAPNDFHHLYVEENARAWPEASVHVSPGLPAKRPKLPFAAELGDEPADLWAADLEQVWMRGAPRVNEIVFFHPRSRTLLLTDLAFNVTDPASAPTRLFMWINGALNRIATSRLMKGMYRDRAAARRSAERVLAWDFDRVVLCHGEVVDSGAKAVLRPVFAWLLDS
jgi:hypothetical protein